MEAQTIRFEAMIKSSPLDFAHQPGPRRGAGGTLRQLAPCRGGSVREQPPGARQAETGELQHRRAAAVARVRRADTALRGRTMARSDTGAAVTCRARLMSRARAALCLVGGGGTPRGTARLSMSLWWSGL